MIRFPRIRRGAACALVFLVPTLALAQAVTPEEPGAGAFRRARWEVGIAAIGGRVSDYPGADQTHARGLLAPVFIYRGPILRVDQEGIRGRMLATSNWEFDLSATGAFNARSNQARRGMPGLDYLFGVGPQLVYKGLRSLPGGPTLHFKLHQVMSTDFRRLERRGVTFEPELRWRLKPFADSPQMLTLSLQPTWASRPLHRYFYQVDASQATSTRPAYDARAGYLGSKAGLALSRRYNDNVSWFVGASGTSYHGSANVDSPMLRDKINYSIGAGLVWTLWRSAETVAD